jgi:hypothetical protein
MPHGVTVDKDDNIWITDVGLHQVTNFFISIFSSDNIVSIVCQIMECTLYMYNT